MVELKPAHLLPFLEAFKRALLAGTISIEEAQNIIVAMDDLVLEAKVIREHRIPQDQRL
jgi:hypothetical protein